ncbi:hypothetical protein EON81_18035 [bacterium]|nr:MAG: hypothetical protein EON81_18035 [bacterium]
MKPYVSHRGRKDVDAYTDNSLTTPDRTGLREIGALFYENGDSDKAISALVSAGFSPDSVQVAQRENGSVVAVFTEDRFDEARDILAANGGDLVPVDLQSTAPIETPLS